MKIRIAPTQIQKQVLAPSMQQSIEILLLPITELNTAIEQELQNNPLLESEENKPESDHVQIDQILNSRMKDDYNQSYLPSYTINDSGENKGEKPLIKALPLEDYLLQQLKLETNDPLELKIGELIIGELNEDGYFKSSCEEIALLLNLKNTKKIESVLELIQNFEPLGVASRNIRECLLIQTHFKLNGDSDLVGVVINNYLKDLGNKRYTLISRKMKIPVEKVKEISRFIATLEPKPARKFRPVSENIYVKPDVIVIKDENDNYQVQLNNEFIPKLRINRFYREMLDKPNRTKEEIDFIHSKIKNATIFIKSIEQRNETIRAIANYIVNYQKEFFEQGHMALKPLKLKDIANTIDRNESTVCRAINQKYMDTPQGLYPMKFFFSQGISNQHNAEDISNRSIKEEIKEIIEAEDKENPLSDQAIRTYFEKKNMKVARRTISKYRQAMKILPSHLRKV